MVEPSYRVYEGFLWKELPRRDPLLYHKNRMVILGLWIRGLESARDQAEITIGPEVWQDKYGHKLAKLRAMLDESTFWSLLERARIGVSASCPHVWLANQVDGVLRYEDELVRQWR